MRRGLSRASRHSGYSWACRAAPANTTTPALSSGDHQVLKAQQCRRPPAPTLVSGMIQGQQAGTCARERWTGRRLERLTAMAPRREDAQDDMPCSACPFSTLAAPMCNRLLSLTNACNLAGQQDAITACGGPTRSTPLPRLHRPECSPIIGRVIRMRCAVPPARFGCRHGTIVEDDVPATVRRAVPPVRHSLPPLRQSRMRGRAHSVRMPFAWRSCDLSRGSPDPSCVTPSRRAPGGRYWTVQHSSARQAGAWGEE